MPILPQDEAAAILRHYLKALTERSGLRWSDANDRDFDRLADLLDAGVAEAPELDSIPPYERPVASDRVTQVFERDELDPNFERWRKQRQADENDRALRRMFEREERGR